MQDWPDFDSLPTRKLGDPDAPRPTWDQLLEAEPRLLELLATARSYHPPSSQFCGNEVWYGAGGLKARLTKLVGDYAESDNPILHGSNPYEVAYQKLYDEVPPCMHSDEFMCRPGLKYVGQPAR